MKIELKRSIRPVAMGLVIFQIAIFLLGATAATSRTIDPNADDPYVSNHRFNVHKILSVLENRTEDQKLLEKAKIKLFTLSDRETRLIASLADRVTQGGNATGSNVAFLLMTALITLL